MQDECELRLDVPLPANGSPRHFEAAWRATLKAQQLTALAMPPARALAARACVYGAADDALLRYLPARLAALPGAPAVHMEARAADDTWRGVRVWLSYAARDLPALLARPKRNPFAPFRTRVRKETP